MPEADTELLTAVARVVEAFDALGVDYLMGGSVASSVFGEPRQTLDADLVARLFGQHAMTKVDVFVRWRDPFGQSQFARRQKKSVGQAAPLELFFASPEDTVLAKLEWFRKGGSVSDRQWRDLLGVLKIQAGALDRAYMVHWADKLGVADLLQRALNEAGLSMPVKE